MPTFPKKFLNISDLNQQNIQDVFHLAAQFKTGKTFPELPPAVLTLAFLEPSTRTKMSFEMAALRLNLKISAFSADSSSSVSKGESGHETLATLTAMCPDVLVVRHGGDAKIQREIVNANMAIINAGDGTSAHPTQALLDGFTIFEKVGRIEGLHILFVGDVEHSRVAQSDKMLFERLGARVGVAAPSVFQPKSADWKGAQIFSELEAGLKWCDVCIGLRIQKERHLASAQWNQEEYVKKFRLDAKNLQPLKQNAWILHPGPFVPELDLHEEILTDPRCLIREQVTNGVYTRMAILYLMLAECE